MADVEFIMLDFVTLVYIIRSQEYRHCCAAFEHHYVDKTASANIYTSTSEWPSIATYVTGHKTLFNH